MLTRVFPVDAATSATAAARLFAEYGVNVMPVVDHGVLVGVVFRGDAHQRLLLPYAFARSASDVAHAGGELNPARVPVVVWRRADP